MSQSLESIIKDCLLVFLQIHACSSSNALRSWTNHSNDCWSRLIQKKLTLVKLKSMSLILALSVHVCPHLGHRVLVAQNLKAKKSMAYVYSKTS